MGRNHIHEQIVDGRMATEHTNRRIQRPFRIRRYWQQQSIRRLVRSISTPPKHIGFWSHFDTSGEPRRRGRRFDRILRHPHLERHQHRGILRPSLAGGCRRWRPALGAAAKGSPTAEKTATPRLGPRNRAAADGPVPGKESLFQSPESRQRNQLTTAGLPAMQLTVEGWGDHENCENMEYERSLIKWSGAGPMESLNVVSGRRMLHECVQAGLYAVYDGNYSEEDLETNKCRFFQLF